MPVTLLQPRSLAALPIALVPLLAAAPALAQQHDEQLWLQANTHIPIADKTRVTLEQIARFSDRQEGVFQTELGALVGYRLTDELELGFGYRWVAFFNANTAADEHRIRQQIVGTFGPVTTRFRVDERFHSQVGGVGVRIRPLVRYNHKLNDKGLVLFVSHESFILPNSTRWGQRAGYERMRNILGLTFPAGKGVSIDAGYLNQFRIGRGGRRDEMDHALSVQITVNFEDIFGDKADD